MILVLADHDGRRLRKATLELCAAARGLGRDQPVTLLVLGSGVGPLADEAARLADQVLVLDAPALAGNDPQVWAAAVAQIATEGGADAVLIAGTRSGRGLAPRVAVRLDAPYLEDVVNLQSVDGGLRATRYAYLARVTETVEALAPTVVVSVKPNAFPAAEPLSQTGEVFEAEVELPAAVVRVLELAAEKSGRVALQEASVVVTGGRGMGSADGFRLIEELADALGGAVGATRAAVDAGWRPYAEQVGQTGKTVQPNLYLTAGVSGAVQHLSGMGKSRFIVAINKDADAPIFKVADYAIVGDLHQVLPAITEAVRKLRV